MLNIKLTLYNAILYSVACKTDVKVLNSGMGYKIFFQTNRPIFDSSVGLLKNMVYALKGDFNEKSISKNI